MITSTEIEALLADLESERVERKAALTDRTRIMQAICAFANDLPNYRQPGVIVIGQNDDGTCASCLITDEMLRTLADMRSNGNILPLPEMTVQKMTIQGCEMAVVVVRPAYYPPVRYDGRTWIRVGPRRAIATAEEERRLTEKRLAGTLPFDQQPVMGATVDDLDRDFFEREYLPSAVAPDILEQNERTLEQQLASLRFLTREGVPTYAAILVFGRNPRAWLPGAYVQFLRLEGTALTDPIQDQKECAGPLSQVMRQIDEIVSAHISLATTLTGPSERRTPDYAIEAVRQVIRNALMHRVYEGTNAPVRLYWFTDRIEIHSPGGPYGQVTSANFGQPGITDYRNPSLAEAMKTLGFVQRFGVGIALARREAERNGNPLIFKADESSVLVTLGRHP